VLSGVSAAEKSEMPRCTLKAKAPVGLLLPLFLELMSFWSIDHLVIWLVPSPATRLQRPRRLVLKLVDGAVLGVSPQISGKPAMKPAITAIDPLMGFGASPGMQASIVRWAENQPDKPSLSEALRRLVELGLTVKAQRKQSKGGRAERAKDLAADAIDSFSTLTADVEEAASRKRRLLKGPEEFRDVRVDRAKKWNGSRNLHFQESDEDHIDEGQATYGFPPVDRPSKGHPVMISGAQVNFDAPADLRKWPSFDNERHTDGYGPYLIVAAPLGECIREFMARPIATRHLYEIQTAPQPPLVSAVLSGELVVELARLRDFL
jgi:hypothetical protein